MKYIGAFLLCAVVLFSCQDKEEDAIKYACPPCDLPCDTIVFNQAGICPHCQMVLIQDESNLVLNEVELETGSGVFLIEGGNGKENKTIKVYYHKPEKYTEDSKILLVVPGAGRNGNSYRNAWIEESEKYNVLILAPMFSEKDYSFEAYHQCGLIAQSNLAATVSFLPNSNVAELNEDKYSFDLNLNSAEWIFADLDRIFDVTAKSLGSLQTQYDVFGHSAGGQILHRLAIFENETKANQIIAANSGFYTLPDFETTLPFGIKNTTIDESFLRSSFKKKLTLLVGELDDENEQGGILLRSITADKQGVHRFARAKYFYAFSKNVAAAIGAEFNWKIETVPNVGHDHSAMGDSAAKLLYD